MLVGNTGGNWKLHLKNIGTEGQKLLDKLCPGTDLDMTPGAKLIKRVVGLLLPLILKYY